MNKELAITSQQFGLLSGIFFWGYFLFEIPSNLLLRKIGARIWIARILISWGIAAMLARQSPLSEKNTSHAPPNAEESASVHQHTPKL
jgi:fucose permease